VLKSCSVIHETGFHMASISSIALSGMNASQAALNAPAHNIANMNTSGFRRQEVVQTVRTGGGVTTTLATSSTEGASLETDVVTQLQAKNSFLANLAVFKASDTMAGALLDMKA
jgi:flagellar hook protein FlgE